MTVFVWEISNLSDSNVSVSCTFTFRKQYILGIFYCKTCSGETAQGEIVSICEMFLYKQFTFVLTSSGVNLTLAFNSEKEGW